MAVDGYSSGLNKLSLSEPWLRAKYVVHAVANLPITSRAGWFLSLHKKRERERERERKPKLDRCQLFVIVRSSRYRSELLVDVFSNDGYRTNQSTLAKPAVSLTLETVLLVFDTRRSTDWRDLSLWSLIRQRASNTSKCTRLQRQKRIACIEKPSAKTVKQHSILIKCLTLLYYSN